MAIGLTWIYAIAGDKQFEILSLQAENKSLKLLQIEKKRFNCKNATETEIINRCIELGKKNDYISFVILAFRSGKTVKEIASELHVTESAVKIRKRRYKKELEE